MRAVLHALVLISALTASACQDRGGSPLRSTIFVPAGYFRAQTLCGAQFQRACDLSYPPPIGKNRHRVMMWLDAFWAETDLVRKVDYEACRVAGVCHAVPARLEVPVSDDPCGYDQLARVPFADADAYCRWRGARLPTPDEYERMARWTDGRRYAAGREPKGCERRPSPEGIRDLNLSNQWTTIAGVAASMGLVSSVSYGEVAPVNFTAVDVTAAFRCVRSAYPTPDPGRARVAPDQIERWLLGGPDG
jgi:hypothetical protein